MTPSTFLRSILRRWYVLVALLIATGFVVSFASSHVSSTYSRSATQILVPGTKSYPTGDNPYLYTGNLTQAASVLVDALSAENVVSGITSAYPGSTIAVDTDTSSNGPMISVQVTAQSNADAGAVLTRIVDQIEPVLTSLQEKANVPRTALITAIPVTADTSSQVSDKSRLEAVAGVGIAGLVVSVLLAALVDALVLALVRARRRAVERKAVRTGAGADIQDGSAAGDTPGDEDPAGPGTEPAPVGPSKKGNRRPGIAVPRSAVAAAAAAGDTPSGLRPSASRNARGRDAQLTSAAHPSGPRSDKRTTEP
jgi:capsular polysaccharide biosynthesis protein